MTKVAGGFDHSLFLKSDGSLWAMGYNQNGQLGDGTYNNTNRPEQIVGQQCHGDCRRSRSQPVSQERRQSMGHGLQQLWPVRRRHLQHHQPARADCGQQRHGDCRRKLPQPFSQERWQSMGHGLEPVWSVGRRHLWRHPASTNRPEQIVASNVTAIAAGYEHSLFLKSDGSLWAMGGNGYGQLGDGTYNTTNRPEQIVASNVTAIAAANYVSLFLKSDGSLWAMGDNEFYGQLGDGTYNNTNQPDQIVASNVTAIAIGGYHSLLLKSDGSLWGVGENQNGQLGDGTYNDTNRPEQVVASGVTAIAAGGGHSLFLKNDGSLWAMGWSEYGQLGDGTSGLTDKTNLPEQIVAGPPGYNQISIQLLSGGNVSLSFVGIAGTNYALDSTFNLSPANWMPLGTNPAGADGVLVFANTPDAATNNFWRIRSVP